MAESMSDRKKRELEAQKKQPAQQVNINNDNINSGLVEAVAIEVTDDHHPPPQQARVVVYEYAASSTNPPVRNNSAVQCCYPVSSIASSQQLLVAHATYGTYQVSYTLFVSHLVHSVYYFKHRTKYSSKRRKLQFEALAKFPRVLEDCCSSSPQSTAIEYTYHTPFGCSRGALNNLVVTVHDAVTLDVSVGTQQAAFRVDERSEPQLQLHVFYQLTVRSSPIPEPDTWYQVQNA